MIFFFTMIYNNKIQIINECMLLKKKVIDSVDTNKLFLILFAYGIPEKIVNAIRIMYENTSRTHSRRETTNVEITTGIFQGDPLAPYLFIIVLEYALRSAIDDRQELKLTRRRSTRHPARQISLCSRTRYTKQNYYYIRWKELPNISDYF